MNANYNQAITIYNRVKSADSEDKREHWYRTVLHGCFFKSQLHTGYDGEKASMTNTYTVRIPENRNYAPYAKFVKAPNSRFTVSEGDIVIKGICTEEITGESPNTASQVLLRHKPDAFKVTAFSDNTSHLMGKHYRLGG